MFKEGDDQRKNKLTKHKSRLTNNNCPLTENLNNTI